MKKIMYLSVFVSLFFLWACGQTNQQQNSNMSDKNVQKVKVNDSFTKDEWEIKWWWTATKKWTSTTQVLDITE